ncbi:hypothetical protein BLNAU_25190 [Blattamonas nauphoetae]|nr:hypothetical protein BLNAU_25190 [Blattamonas nauphoetae]
MKRTDFIAVWLFVIVIPYHNCGDRICRSGDILTLSLNVEAASRMTPTRFCGLSSDVGNAVIAAADEQIL